MKQNSSEVSEIDLLNERLEHLGSSCVAFVRFSTWREAIVLCALTEQEIQTLSRSSK